MAGNFGHYEAESSYNHHGLVVVRKPVALDSLVDSPVENFADNPLGNPVDNHRSFEHLIAGIVDAAVEA